jgi:pyruvate kinase
MPASRALLDRPAPLKRRRTKILATLGPASADPDTLRALIDAGVDVFRLNFSHGSADDHRANAAKVRSVAEAAGRPVALLGDLCGPKLRVGVLPDDGVELVTDSTVDLALHTGPTWWSPTAPRIPVPHPELADDILVGHRLLFDDGALELRVLERHPEPGGDMVLRCSVVRGGILKTRKGMNLPDSRLRLPALTEKDLADLEVACSIPVDWIALSFVRSASDLVDLRARLDVAHAPRIVAKIERPEALEHIDAILQETDAIMVARGDLGVEVPAETVPHLQDELVRRARRAKKPVVIATQMLDSMIERSRPTRAEASDIAHAVATGADAIMLSGETAVGSFPVAAVATMDRIARETEARQWESGAFAGLDLVAPLHAEDPEPSFVDGVADGITRLSRTLQARAVVVVSESGTSALTVSAARPAAPLLAAVPDPAIARGLCLAWGLVPCVVEASRLQDPIALGESLARELDLADDGQVVLVAGGFRVPPETSTPSIHVVRLG